MTVGEPGLGDDGAHLGHTDPTAGRTGTARLGEDPARGGTLTDPTAGVLASARNFASESARAVADPGPLGLAGFALTTFLLSMVNAKVMSAGTEPIVYGTALAYGGIAQLLAGMWEFRKGNTFGATAFGSYGGFWISFWFFVQFDAGKVPSADVASAVGWYLIAWGFFTTIMFVASFRTTTALVLLFALLAATYYVLGISDLTGTSGLGTFGGWLGIATAAVAWYAAMAGVTNSTFGRAVLPNPPLNLR